MLLLMFALLHEWKVCLLLEFISISLLNYTAVPYAVVHLVTCTVTVLLIRHP